MTVSLPMVEASKRGKSCEIQKKINQTIFDIKKWITCFYVTVGNTSSEMKYKSIK